MKESTAMLEAIDEHLTVAAVIVQDLRWPTSLDGHGSDAMVRKGFSFSGEFRGFSQNLSLWRNSDGFASF